MSAAEAQPAADLRTAIAAHDDLIHTSVGADDWRENWWLAFFDHGRGIRGIVYGGVQPLRGRAFVLFAMFKGDRPVYVLDSHELGENEFDHATATVGPLSFECIEPFRQWRYRIDHPVVSGSLEWTSAHAAYDWSWGETTGSRHYEQPGRVRGAITVGDENYEVDGWGQRDRAWGHRAENSLRSAWSSRVLFGEEDLQHASIITLGGRTFLFGYRISNDRAMLIDRLKLSTSYAYRGGPPLNTELLAWAGDEQIADQQVRLANVVPRFSVAAATETHQYFTFSEWYEGATSRVGQLDHWWSSPYEVSDILDVTGNDGRWVQL
jgi:hypothetical protein